MKRAPDVLVPVLSVATLALLIMATALQWHWVWGLLFAYWMVSGLLRAESYLLTPIRRTVQPVLFWAATLTWGGLSLWFLADIFV
ncbi:MAG: hypothetical protein AAGA68_13405 [Pseudomonadota bacterium]